MTADQWLALVIFVSVICIAPGAVRDMGQRVSARDAAAIDRRRAGIAALERMDSLR